MAVSPASAPGLRTVAVSCDIERPRRSARTSTSTGPPRTTPANMAVSVRRRLLRMAQRPLHGPHRDRRDDPALRRDGQLPRLADRRREAPVADLDELQVLPSRPHAGNLPTDVCVETVRIRTYLDTDVG